MIELVRAMLYSQQSFLGFLMGGMMAFVSAAKNRPQDGWDWGILAGIVLISAIRQSAVLNAPSIVQNAAAIKASREEGGP